MRILSGIQPSGKLHIGNYFGMMRPALELAQKGEAFYFIADYHALTSISDPDELRANVLDVALDFLACGLDPSQTVFYRQSDVPQVTELTWILSNVTPLPMLENAHSYKDKIAQGLKPNAGLFTYPVLMAADILIVHGARVPVGKDQKQHVEMTRDIAGAFNRQFGEVFTIPDAVIRPEVATLPGIDGRKMSKSYNNTVEIFGDEKATKKKVMSVVTDSQPVEAPKVDLNKNIPLQLYKLVATPEKANELQAKLAAGGYGYGEVKKELLATLTDYFAPFRKKREELVKNLDYVHEVLRKGAARANAVADETMTKVREAVGLDSVYVSKCLSASRTGHTDAQELMESDYKVKLEVFEGPLDLLLYLIKKEEVDIYDIPIERITNQYMEYLSLMQLLNLEVAGEFLVMAATLMYIKSRMLLPADQQVTDSETEEGEDPRWELIRQLVEYKKFKDAALQLGRREEEQANIFPRRGPDAGVEVDKDVPLAEVSIFDLINAFNDVLKKASAREDFREIIEERFTVSDKIEEILYTLRDRSEMIFNELFANASSRAEVVVTFLALLELIRLKRLKVLQVEAFGEIRVIKVI